MIGLTSKLVKLCLLLMTPTFVFAMVPAWQIVPAQSSLTFTATQNDAPVSGEFKKFSGIINFDPNQLNANNIKITVELGSVSDAYNQLADTLAGADWFNTKAFPQAIFTANKFTKTGDKSYQAIGTLTIRDKSQPVTLNFTQEDYSPTRAKVRGSTMIKRTAFGVGQGEWSDTKAVKDDVQVNFEITATRK